MPRGAMPAVLFSIALTAGCHANVVRGMPQAAPPSPPPAVGEPNLDAFLPSADETARVMNAPGLVIIDRYSSLQPLPDSKLSDPNCFGALYAATEPAYAGRPVTTVRSQLLQEPTDSYSHRVVEAVVRFINADEAISYVNAEMSVWSQCSGRSVAWRDHGAEMTWDVGSLTRSADVAALPRTRADHSGWACSHAMVPRLNVVADVTACGVGGNVVAESVALAQLVAGRIKS